MAHQAIYALLLVLTALSIIPSCWVIFDDRKARCAYVRSLSPRRQKELEEFVSLGFSWRDFKRFETQHGREELKSSLSSVAAIF
jgi:hypothetical protein